MAGKSPLADFWFDLLDGRMVTDGRLLVQGIHVDGDTVWVQVARAEQPLSRLLLHIRPRATLRDVLAALREASTGSDRIEVPHAA
jgi:hypothetical protein